MFVDGVEIDDSIQIPKEGRVLVEVQMEVMEGVSNGVSGIIKVSAASERTSCSNNFGRYHDSSNDHTRSHLYSGGGR